MLAQVPGIYALVSVEFVANTLYHSGLCCSGRVAGNHKPPDNQMLTKLKIARLTLPLTLFCVVLAQPVLAEGAADRGEALAYTCLGCHGIEGYRNAYPSYRVPKLGGQKAAYLVAAVKGYRDGTRKHPTMEAQATSMSDQDIADIAAYLSTIGADTVAAGGSEGLALEAAQTCAACHGPNGIGVSPTWPTLAGQHEDYLVQALNQYRDGVRTEATMAQMAASLADADVELLARYYSRLDGLETTKPK
jgi:cytochrome c553